MQRQKNKLLLIALLEAGINQHELARCSGVSYVQVNALCNGRNLPKPETARKIAAALGKSKKELGLSEVWGR